MASDFVANRKVALLGLATAIFGIGYGLFLAVTLIDGVDGWSEVAAVLMGAGLLLSLVIGLLAMVELQRFLGKAE